MSYVTPPPSAPTNVTFEEVERHMNAPPPAPVAVACATWVQNKRCYRVGVHTKHAFPTNTPVTSKHMTRYVPPEEGEPCKLYLGPIRCNQKGQHYSHLYKSRLK